MRFFLDESLAGIVSTGQNSGNTKTLLVLLEVIT